MKRRLSVAISAIGNPFLIILDEPTSFVLPCRLLFFSSKLFLYLAGMDIKNRLKVWELIRRLKTNRVILMTSHSMEEADSLCDRLAIMYKGKLKCVGDGLHLKSRFCRCFAMTFFCHSYNASQFWCWTYTHSTDRTFHRASCCRTSSSVVPR